ncbi:MAG: bifunctional oligoribonuclease/PAP phosphatase NrnA [Bacilli bacterium]
MNQKKDEFSQIKLEIFNKIKAYETIIIHRHIRPDGDCIGSSLGLRNILRNSFPNKKIYSAAYDTAKYLEFLGQEDTVSEEYYKDALVIVVDTSNASRIAGGNYNKGKEIIKIDHHIEVEKYGAINYVRENFPSTSIVIMDFFETFKTELKMDVDGAKALYVATITDTGRFRYNSVTGQTLRLAGNMLDYGFNTDDIYANLHIKNKEILKLQGYVLNHFKTSPNGVSYIYLSDHIQKKFGVSNEDASALVNTLDSIQGSLIWLLFIDIEGVIRVRLRSRYTGVVDIARRYHGGGHFQASGAMVKNRKEMKQMVKEADEALKAFKAENKDVF